MRGEFFMSEADIRSKLPQAQADKVIEFLEKGWRFKEIEKNGDVILVGNGSYTWVKDNGHSYPVIN